MTMQTRVLIADDRPRSRRGLKAVLALRPEIEIVGEAADGQEAVRLVAECHPDVVLMDARMPVMDGVEATGLNFPASMRPIVCLVTPAFSAS
jgi:YesN/AraC family two-component response regulator